MKALNQLLQGAQFYEVVKKTLSEARSEKLLKAFPFN